MYDLSKLFLFRGLPGEELKRILETLTDVRDFGRGETLYDGAHFRRALGVFLSGRGYAGDRDAKKTDFGEGDVFGAAALFGAGDIYVSRIVARAACRVLFIPEDRLCSLIECYPACAVNYVAFLTERIRFLNRKIAQYTGSTAAARLYRLLDERADESGRVQNVNLTLFAELSGLGRTSVYRALKELEADGSVRRENRNIYIRRSSEV